MTKKKKKKKKVQTQSEPGEVKEQIEKNVIDVTAYNAEINLQTMIRQVTLELKQEEEEEKKQLKKT